MRRPAERRGDGEGDVEARGVANFRLHGPPDPPYGQREGPLPHEPPGFAGPKPGVKQPDMSTELEGKRVAVIGGGISGLGAAYLLKRLVIVRAASDTLWRWLGPATALAVPAATSALPPALCAEY